MHHACAAIGARVGGRPKTSQICKKQAASPASSTPSEATAFRASPASPASLAPRPGPASQEPSLTSTRTRARKHSCRRVLRPQYTYIYEHRLICVYICELYISQTSTMLTFVCVCGHRGPRHRGAFRVVVSPWVAAGAQPDIHIKLQLRTNSSKRSGSCGVAAGCFALVARAQDHRLGGRKWSPITEGDAGGF